MDTVKLSVHEREETGNGPARRLRAKGLVPAVTYGKGKTPTSIAINLVELKEAASHGHNIILELDFVQAAKGAKAKDKAPRFAVVKQIQIHPVRRQVLHVDLHEIDLAVEIEALVAVEAFGTPAGAEDGGVVEWERREVNVRALPSSVPEVLQLDLTPLLIGHHLSVSALQAPEGVTIIDDPETLLVALVPPRGEQPGAEAGEEVAEPEVVGSPKSEE
jgi:large subunit ribosomal protein L25